MDEYIENLFKERIEKIGKLDSNEKMKEHYLIKIEYFELKVKTLDLDLKIAKSYLEDWKKAYNDDFGCKE